MLDQFIENPNWTVEQKKVLQSDQSALVTGAAGTGKTLVACHLAKIKAEHGSVLFLVYTKALAHYIKVYFQRIGAQNIVVMYEYEWKQRNYKKHDFIIIDEYQDFTETDIHFTKEQAEQGLYIFGDDQQSIYKHNYSKEKTIDLKTLRKLTGFTVHRLTFQKRIHYNNCLFFREFFSLGTEKGCHTINKQVEFKYFNSIEDETNWLVSFLKKTKYKNIAILLKQNEDVKGEVFYDGPTEMKLSYPGIINLHRILSENDIPHGYKVRQFDNLDFTQEQSINIMTYHSSKGLQFDCVILPFSSIGNSYYDHKVSYVAMSRSSSKILITYSSFVGSEYHLFRNQRGTFSGHLEFYNNEYMVQQVINEIAANWKELE